MSNALERGLQDLRLFLNNIFNTHNFFALKKLIKTKINFRCIALEMIPQLRQDCTHPNILQLLCWFHDSHRIYLAMEYAGQGELFRKMHDSPGGHFSEQSSAKYIYQVADAVNYCHQNKVIHRDIKPENLLLTLSGDIKLADFGWAVHSPSLRRKTMCGTVDYLPPEMVENKSYGKYVDHWCIGVLCFEFLTGSPPFEGKNNEITFAKIKANDFKFPLSVPSGAQDLISKLLVHSGAERISLNQVMSHFWIIFWLRYLTVTMFVLIYCFWLNYNNNSFIQL